MPHPNGRPPERHQPRRRADAGQQHQRAVGAACLLRAHAADDDFAAVPGRPEQAGAEEVPGHGRRGLRVPVRWLPAPLPPLQRTTHFCRLLLLQLSSVEVGPISEGPETVLRALRAEEGELLRSTR